MEGEIRLILAKRRGRIFQCSGEHVQYSGWSNNQGAWDHKGATGIVTSIKVRLISATENNGKNSDKSYWNSAKVVIFSSPVLNVKSNFGLHIHSRKILRWIDANFALDKKSNIKLSCYPSGPCILMKENVNKQMWTIPSGDRGCCNEKESHQAGESIGVLLQLGNIGKISLKNWCRQKWTETRGAKTGSVSEKIV